MNIENKNCQAEKCDMQPLKFEKDMWLKEPAAKDKNCQVTMQNKKLVPLYKDNNCKSIRIYNKSECSDVSELNNAIKLL